MLLLRGAASVRVYPDITISSFVAGVLVGVRNRMLIKRGRG
jgi:hypothetical protein